MTTGETIAVKQVEMPRSFSDKEDQRTKGMISSLKAEIELLKDLDHPNIVLYLGSSFPSSLLCTFGTDRLVFGQVWNKLTSSCRFSLNMFLVVPLVVSFVLMAK